MSKTGFAGSARGALMSYRRVALATALVVVLIGAGCQVKPDHATFDREVIDNDPTGSSPLYHARYSIRGNYPIRGLPVVSHGLSDKRVQEPKRLTRVCDGVTLVDLYTVFALPYATFWIGCGGVESGFV
jgi:hypothetical protein